MKEVILDTETTGLDVKDGHRIVEIGCLELDNFVNLSNLSSITSTIPILGSIVQKGKLAASAFLDAVKALNKVDFPTLGSPTIPHLNPIKILINFTRK